MPSNKEITRRIKNYISDHPKMQSANVPLIEMERCAFFCRCTTYQVMVVIQLGSL